MQTTGFTGADLANLVNEAALLAGRGNKGEGHSCAGRPVFKGSGTLLWRDPDLSPQPAGLPCPCGLHLPTTAALLAHLYAGIVSNADFDSAILRAVAGIEKKRSVLQVRFLHCWACMPCLANVGAC